MNEGSRAKAMTAAREVSAGGVVLGTEGVLLIKVENLQGHVVWTFPKGHLEKGESPEAAALREVKEETGWTCRLVSPMGILRYRFMRDRRPVAKVVHWFRMAPLDRTGVPDPEEVLDCRWTTLSEASGLVTYPSDRKILKRLKEGAP